MGSLWVQMYVSASICVSWAFSLASFLILVCFVPFWFVYVCFYIIFYYYSFCLFSKERHKGCRYRQEGKNRLTWRRQERRNCNLNILYEKNLFSVKEKYQSNIFFIEQYIIWESDLLQQLRDARSTLFWKSVLSLINEDLKRSHRVCEDFSDDSKHTKPKNKTAEGKVM